MRSKKIKIPFLKRYLTKKEEIRTYSI